MRAVEIIHNQSTWMSTTNENFSSTKSPLDIRNDINFFAGQQLLRNQEKNDLQYSYGGSEFLSCSPIHTKDRLHICTEHIEDFEEFPIRKPRKSRRCSLLLSDQGYQSDTGISSNTVPVIVRIIKQKTQSKRETDFRNDRFMTTNAPKNVLGKWGARIPHKIVEKRNFLPPTTKVSINDPKNIGSAIEPICHHSQKHTSVFYLWPNFGIEGVSDGQKLSGGSERDGIIAALGEKGVSWEVPMSEIAPAGAYVLQDFSKVDQTKKGEDFDKIEVSSLMNYPEESLRMPNTMASEQGTSSAEKRQGILLDKKAGSSLTLAFCVARDQIEKELANEQSMMQS